MTFEEAYLEETGRQSVTTFWQDFAIADRFGLDAVKDTFNRSKYWVTNVDYWVELTFVLNWRCWQHKNAGRRALSELYSDLYYDALDYFHKVHPADSEEAKKFFELTD